MSQASNFFTSLGENSLKIQDKLRKLLKNNKLEIKNFKLLKDKLIIDDQHKITVLLNLKNNRPEKVVLEIHDNYDYFKRNIFAQIKLKNLINPPKFLGKFSKPKIIIRNLLEGEFFWELIFKKMISMKEIAETTQKMALALSSLHNMNIKSLPKFLSKELNRKVERKILKRTMEFITPKLKFLRNKIRRNLSNLLAKMDDLDSKNKTSLIHGDYQPANFILKNTKIYLTDFDTMELGNPARDLGRFLYQMEDLMREYSFKIVEKIEELFLKAYLDNKKGGKKLVLKPDLKTNIDLHKAEMIQYIILGKIWDRKIPEKKEIKKIEQLLKEQEKLLNI